MAEDTTTLSLLEYLGRHYVTLKQRLTRRLGSGELAGDALHDAWLRLRYSDPPDLVQDPGAYLTRMAVNLSIDMQRRHSRVLSGEEIDALMQELADPLPQPERAAELTEDVDALAELLERMPPRRRAIALLVHAEGVTQREAAARLGVSLRTVEYEVKRIQDRLDAHLGLRDEQK